MDNVGLLTEYAEEASEYMMEIEKNILELEKERNSRECVNTLFRNLHSLKGLSGFVNMTSIFNISHESETLLDFYRKKKIEADDLFFKILLKANDLMYAAIESIRKYNKVVDETKLAEHIEEIKKYIINGKKSGEVKSGTIEKAEIEVKTEVKEAVSAPSQAGKKYLIYLVDKENYGVEISNVKEIIGMMPITAIPKVKKYIKGIINLRGKIIPVIDIRARMDITETAYSDRTCIIIIETAGEKGKKNIGIIVDMVTEVTEIKDEYITPMQHEDIMMREELILGTAKLGERLVMIIDIANTANTLKGI